ncbi:MAG: branched-chain amino acid transport system II carrier protein [Erysipelotrichaceae bacterium]|jgi:LIVCS family branched-chain amino acid:cation transporter
MNRLSFKQRFLVAVTLFGMFFGAGNLIFPVHLGQLAGKNVIAAMIGFIITAVTIPILGVAAIGNTHSDDLHSLSDKVSKGYGYFFTCLLYLTIGPFFAIPRCATTSFTSIEPMISEGVSKSLMLFIFSLIFFAFVLFFSLRPSKITVWIGKIINPLFLIFLSILVVTALLNPSISVNEVTPVDAYQNAALFSGFIEGYGTMDAIAGLAFGIVVIDIIRAMGLKEDNDIAREVLKSGVITGILMAVIYIATIVMGAQSRGLFELSANGGIALAQISNHYLGKVGGLVLALTITFATLKTSIGLVTSCSQAFVRMFPKGLSYNLWAIIFTVFSFAVSNIGLSNIISYSIPVLMFLYPLAITLILLALTGDLFNHDKIVYQSVIGFTLLAAVFDLLKTLPASLQGILYAEKVTDLARKILPFFDLNLGWLVPSLIGLAVGLTVRFVIREKRVGT